MKGKFYDMSYSIKAKDEMAERAKRWYHFVELNYPDEIASSIASRRIFTTDRTPCLTEDDFIRDFYCNGTPYKTAINKEQKSDSHFYFVNDGTVEALFDVTSEKVAVLNFASYKEPGGRFLDGSKAQEENLCHRSTLFPVLVDMQSEYYSPNCSYTNESLYLNKLLYVKDIVFFDKDGNEKLADVITCAAPNLIPYKRYNKHLDNEKYTKILYDRIDLIFASAYAAKVDTLILGAWGCGVYMNDPFYIASIFRKFNAKYNGFFSKIVYAVPGNYDNNVIAFRDICRG